MRSLELLAPARDLECGLAAIRHGADAVYIGAERFGARTSAGNTVDDIARLCDYAHLFGARVYVTVNTLIYDDELKDTGALVTGLTEAGVDALLVQDMATLALRQATLRKLGHAPALHASTQCDNRTAEKVSWLQSLGFQRAVLARELSAKEVAEIHREAPDMELEVFVHGALCVSYSGVCYASQCCFGRSANRGACAQFCRLPFDLLDTEGIVLARDRHLLSLKDLCLIDHLEELAEAGATSFKIEGRLKGKDYVSNVVSAYSQRLDRLVKLHPDQYRRSSGGSVDYRFEPDLRKTFNRGFTTYFLHGRQRGIASFDTPKALGEPVGHAKELRPDSLTVAGTAAFANGDGLCFVSEQHELVGFRVNRAEGNVLHPYKMPAGLRRGMALFRNHDVAFERILASDATDRKLPVSMLLDTMPDGFQLTIKPIGESGRTTPQGATGRATVRFAHQTAQKPQGDNMRQQLSKLGGTPLALRDLTVTPEAARLFLPSSLLAELRRQATSTLLESLKGEGATAQGDDKGAQATVPLRQPSEYEAHPYLYNVANRLARDFYAAIGQRVGAPAYELQADGQGPIMQCRHCLRFALGHCVKRGGARPTWHEPLYLRLGDGRKFRLEFNCDHCQMNVYPADR